MKNYLNFITQLVVQIYKCILFYSYLHSKISRTMTHQKTFKSVLYFRIQICQSFRNLLYTPMEYEFTYELCVLNIDLELTLDKFCLRINILRHCERIDLLCSRWIVHVILTVGLLSGCNYLNLRSIIGLWWQEAVIFIIAK